MYEMSDVTCTGNGESKTQKTVIQIQGDEEKMNICQLFRRYVNIIRYDQIISSVA